MTLTRSVNADSYNPDIVTFVTSLYSDCLGREPDSTGLNAWCTQLTNHTVTGKQCAYGFFFSQEFQSKANSLSDTELITAYYRVFLNRTPDPGGASYWATQISNTTNDISILFTGFADSTEFSQKCASYGIDVGDHIQVPITTRSTSTAAPVASTSANTSTLTRAEEIASIGNSSSDTAITYIINSRNGTIHRAGCSHLPAINNQTTVSWTQSQLGNYSGHRCGFCFS